MPDNSQEARDTLFLAGGVALAVFGAGLILSHAGIRRTLMNSLSTVLPGSDDPLKAGIGGVFPDVERYLRIRSM